MGDFFQELEMMEETYTATGTVSHEDAVWLLGWVRTLADALQREKDRWRLITEDGTYYVASDIPITGEE